MVAITGQVARHMIGRDAFQETDVIGITQPITKHSVLVRIVDELAETVREAFCHCPQAGPARCWSMCRRTCRTRSRSTPGACRPAPALRPTADSAISGRQPAQQPSSTQAQRPLILAGHGVILSDAYDELRALAERTGIPVVTTLLGISAFPESHPLPLGMPGMHGEVHVNHAIQHADVLVGVGMRFDDRVTGNIADFAPRRASFISTSIPPKSARMMPAVPIVADARIALDALARAGRTHPRRLDGNASRPGGEAEAHWNAASRTARREDSRRSRETILAAIRKATDGRAHLVTDVGQHQMWVARSYRYEHPNTHLTSGGLGTMGFAVPAAMGAAIGRPEEPVWVVSGDGGFQMNMQEMATMVRIWACPVKMAIFNNGYLGMVRQWQQFFHERNYSDTRILAPTT